MERNQNNCCAEEVNKDDDDEQESRPTFPEEIHFEQLEKQVDEEEYSSIGRIQQSTNFKYSTRVGFLFFDDQQKCEGILNYLFFWEEEE